MKTEYLTLGDAVVEIYEHREKTAPKQLSRFLWNNPAVKVKIN